MALKKKRKKFSLKKAVKKAVKSNSRKIPARESEDFRHRLKRIAKSKITKG